jgi:hypothetical protein
VSSKKPENVFIAVVHKHLPLSVYREKMYNPYRGGTPDVWYSGDASDLWVEYKYIAKIPKRTEITADLSPLQKQWLAGRLAEGRRVAVIIGSPSGGVVLENRSWLESLTPQAFTNRILTRAQLADWILSKVQHEPRSVEGVV